MPLSETALSLGSGWITPDDVVRVSRSDAAVRMDASAYARIDSARAIVAGIVASDEPAYGVTRGLGSLRDQRIPSELQDVFQSFVFASHHAGTGGLLSREEARAVIVSRLAVMARGNSGASRSLVDGLIELVSHDVTPAIPVAGSVGSADLALLAAVGAVLVGNGRALDSDGALVPGSEALRRSNLEPVRLEAKDGHALVVANSGSVGIGSLAAVDLARVSKMADLAAANTVEALTFNVGVFDAEVLSARPHPGQLASGARFRRLFADGALAAGEVSPISLQDPLSFRTIPQVHGVLLEQIDHLHSVLSIELNSMPENPYIVFREARMVSNGNFSAIRLALALDQSRVALAHLAMLAERRIAVCVGRLRADRSLVEQLTSYREGAVPVVPPILANVAASLSSRIQYLACPTSVITAIVGDGVEDHNSQAYAAALRLREAIDAAEQLIAVESLAAAGVASLDPNAISRRRGTALARIASGSERILRSYEASGGTQQQLDDLRALLRHESSLLSDEPRGSVSTPPTRTKAPS